MSQTAFSSFSKAVNEKASDAYKKLSLQWFDVAMTANTSIVVSHYYIPVEEGDENVG